MNRGILFYVDGPKPLPELVVAFHTLKKYNPHINVHITVGPETPLWFHDVLDENGISHNIRHHLPRDNRKNTDRRSFVWTQKPYIIRDSPFDLTLYYDCDHVFLKPINPDIWKLISSLGLITGMSPIHYPNRRTFLVWRDAFNMLLPGLQPFTKDDFKTFFRVNGGCVGHRRGSRLIHQWIEIMETLLASDITNRRLFTSGDEVGLALTLNRRGVGWAEDVYSYNYHPYKDVVSNFEPGTMAVHYSRSAYQAKDTRKTMWCAGWREAIHNNTLSSKYLEDKYISCNYVVSDVLGSK